MSFAKRELDRLEDARAVARAIAVQVGLLERCSYCGDHHDPLSWNFEDAYRLGNWLISHGDERTDVFEDRREMTDLVQAVVNDTPQECHCQYQARKDT